MPPTSIPQAHAMYAAASGKSTLGIPVSVGKEFIGDGPPQKRPAKKPTHRGRKPSTKPGASHLAALQKAHGAGDLKAAKTHALNYAKAVHVGAMSDAEPDAGDPNDMMEDEAPESGSASPSAPPIAVRQAPASQTASRVALARLAMRPKAK